VAVRAAYPATVIDRARDGELPLPAPVLTTDRLMLRPFTPDDLDDVRVSCWVPGVPGRVRRHTGPGPALGRRRRPQKSAPVRQGISCSVRVLPSGSSMAARCMGRPPAPRADPATQESAAGGAR